LEKLTGLSIGIDWRRLFGKDYRSVERQIVQCRAYADTNPTAWVNAMDVFNDWLLIALYKRDPALGAYTPGKVGSIMGSTRLKSSYPRVLTFVQSVHNKRYESSLSHAKIKKSGRATAPIRFQYLKTGRRLLRNAVSELERSM
jgi:hypothetical protein